VTVKAEFPSFLVVREIMIFGRIIIFPYDVANPAFIGRNWTMKILSLSHGLMTFRGHTALLCQNKEGKGEGKN
jgi:hypothetical protein